MFHVYQKNESKLSYNFPLIAFIKKTNTTSYFILKITSVNGTYSNRQTEKKAKLSLVILINLIYAG